jgi:hypothetical protein
MSDRVGAAPPRIDEDLGICAGRQNGVARSGRAQHADRTLVMGVVGRG